MSASALDAAAAGEYTSTRDRLSALLEAAALTDAQKAEIEAQFPSPWTDAVIAKLTSQIADDSYTIYYKQFVDTGSMSEEDAKKEAKADAEKVIKSLIDEPDADMLFGNAYVLDLELDEAVLAEFTSAEQQEPYEFQSTLLNLQNAIEESCGYVSAGLLLDKNLNEYESGLEIMAEMGITLSSEYAAMVEAGTLDMDSDQIGTDWLRTRRKPELRSRSLNRR